MNKLFWTTLVALGLSAAAAWAQPSLSKDDIAKVKKEVTEAVHHYYRLFTERNMKALPQEIFHVPFVYLAPDGPRWTRRRR
jgi:hypothetical protein